MVDHLPNDPLTGFSATVFQNIDTGAYTLAIRGTDESLEDLLLSDIFGVFGTGIASAQVVDLYNYYQRLITPTDQAVSQWVPINEGAGVYYQNTGSAQGLEKLASTTSLNVTGHSLGGHLAAAFSRLFPDVTQAAYEINGLGFYDTNYVNGLFNQLAGQSTSFNPAKISNLFGEAGPEVATNNNPHIQYGTRLPVFIEDQNSAIGNHGKELMTDALGLASVFAAIDPSLNTMNPRQAFQKLFDIMEASASTANKSLEATLDALRTLFQENFTFGTPDTNATPTTVDNRDGFYTNLFSLQSYIEGLPTYNSNTKNLGLSVDSLVDQGATSLFNTAQTDIATRYALYKLNPFVINNADDLYSAINNSSGALDVYNPTTNTGALSDQYLKDRSAFLTNKILSGVGDKSAQSGDPLAIRNGSPLYFEDRGSTSTYGLYQGENNAVSEIPFEEIAQVVFGHSGTDLIGGGDQADRLYGMAGNDQLTGNKGNDYLEGGQGTDTYIYTSNDGLDTILDTDGLGQITFNGVDLTGGDKLFGETYKSSDGQYLYTLLHNTGEQDSLLINAKGGTILIKDFQSGELNITLNAGTASQPTSIFTGTNNNDADLIDTGVPVGVAGGGVLDANWSGYAAYGQTVNPYAEGSVGAMFFLSRLGQPYPENTIFDALYGEAGDDYLLGNPGGHDFLLDGGAGDDWIVADYNFDYVSFRPTTDYAALQAGVTIYGGDGNDAILGSHQDDAIDAGAGHDQVFADAVTVNGHRGNGEDYIDGGTGNDWLSGGAGSDVIIGGPDSATETDHDTLLGAAGSDYLEGGAGDDRLYGDTDGGFPRNVVSWPDGSTHLQAWNGATQQHLFADYTGAPETTSILDDVPIAEAGDDYLDGGTGNDKLFGGAGDDILDGGTDNDLLYGEAGDDELIGGAGNDKLWGDLDNAVYNQDQQITETHGALLLFNRKYAAGFDAEGDDILDGGAGDDELRGNGGDDILRGGEGNDTLVGGAGADVLDGGLGDDLIYRDADDTIVFRVGDGNDQITSAPGGLLRIEDVTPETLAITSVTGFDGYQYLTLGFGDDSISIQGGFLGGDQTYQIGSAILTQRELMQYAPNVSTEGSSRDDVIYGGNSDDSLRGNRGNDTLDGQGGNDWLDGGLGNDTYVFGRGYGIDHIQEYDDTIGNQDTLRFLDGITANDLTVARDGDNLVVGIKGTADKLVMYDWWFERYHLMRSRIERAELADGTVVDLAALVAPLPGTDGDDYLYGNSAADVLFGRDGWDDLFAEAGDDILAGGAGGDYLIGGAGNDVYLFNSGDGSRDYIDDGFSTDQNSIDTLSFGGGIRPEDIDAYLKFQKGYNGANFSELILQNRNTGEDLWIAWTETNHFGYDNFLSTDDRRIERIQFLGSGDNRVFNLKGLVDARFSDLRNAWDGDGYPIPLFTPDALQAFDVTGQVDFAGGQYALNYATTGEVSDISGDTAPEVTQAISDQFVEQYSPFRFQIPPGTFADPDASDTLRYYARSVYGTILPLWLTFDEDTLTFSGTPTAPGTFDISVIAADGYNLYAQDAFTVAVAPYSGVKIGTDGNDLITGTPVADTLYGLAGDDRLSGGNGNDVLDGGTGADEMRGGAGDDTYVVDNAGDTVVEDANAGTDIVRSAVSFTLGQNVENLVLTGADNLSGSGNNLDNVLTGNNAANVLNGAGGNDTLYGAGGADVLTGDAGNDRLFGGDGNDSLDGGTSDDLLAGDLGDDSLMGGAGNDTLGAGDGNDTLNGGAGADSLEGSAGDDAYVFRIGDGSDVITDARGHDRIVFGEGIDPSTLGLSQYQGDDGRYYLRINYGAGSDSMVIQDGVLGRIESYEFADGTVLDHGQLMQRYNLPLEAVGADEADTLYGADLADTLQGNGGDDLLIGNGGDDTLDGGTGDDTLEGGAGDDVYVLRWGMGRDTVIDSDGLNTLQLDPGIGLNDLSAKRQQNDLLVNFRGASDGTLLKDYYLYRPAWQIRTSTGETQDLATFLDQTIPDSTATIQSVMERYKSQVKAAYYTLLGNNGFGLRDDGKMHNTNEETAFYGVYGSPVDTHIHTTYETAEYLETTTASDSAVISRQSSPYSYRGLGGDHVSYAFVVAYSNVTAGSNTVESLGKFYPGGIGLNKGISISGPFATIQPVYGRKTSLDLHQDSENEFLGYWVFPSGTSPLVVSGYRTVDYHYAESYENLTLETIRGGASNNTITIPAYSIVDAGDGDDILIANVLDSYWPHAPGGIGPLLYGGAGNDTLLGGSYGFGDRVGNNELLIGGAGNDFLSGSEGADTYLFFAGDPGVDIVMDTGQPHWEVVGFDMSMPFFSWYYQALGLSIRWPYDDLPQFPPLALNDYQGWEFMFQSGLIAKDTVEFGEGIRLSDLQLSWGEYLSPQNLAFGTYRNEHDSAARFDASTLALTTLDISWGPDQAVRVVIPPSLMFLADAPSDFLRGTGGWPFFMGGYGWGIEQFKFSDDSIMSMLDMLRLAPPAPTFDPFNVDGVQTGTDLPEEIYGAGGDDVLTGAGGNDYLIGGDGNDTLDSGEGNDYLSGGTGHDYLDGGSGADFFVGGAGDDILYGGMGDDIYVFNPGNGTDTIHDNAGENNTLIFGPGIDAASIVLRLGSLYLDIGNGEGIHIEGFNPNDVYGSSVIQTLTFDDGDDGTTLSFAELLNRGFDLAGGAGDDIIVGTNATDRITGGIGNDVLSGGAGDDTYVFNLGDGFDAALDAAGMDTLRFGAGITSDNLTTDTSGNDLLIHVGNDTLTIQNWFLGSDYWIENIQFNDGSNHDAAWLESLSRHVPELITPLPDQSASEDNPFSLELSGAFSDADLGRGDYLSFSAVLAGGTALPDWLNIDSLTGALSGLTGNSLVGSYDVIVTATDSDGQSVSDTFTLTVNNTNDVPVVANTITDQTIDEDAPFNLDLAGVFTDDDLIHGDRLILTASLADGSILPDWLTFDALTGTFTGTPDNWQVGSHDIQVTATDLAGTSASDAFTLTVNNVNDNPVLANALGDIATDEDAPFSFTVSSNTFFDDDFIHGDSLSLSVALADGSVLPDWLSFDATTGTFTGTPDNWSVGNYDIRVTATDTAGASVFDDFTLTVNNINDAPVLANPLTDQMATEGVAFSYTLAGDTFHDDDAIHGDALTYTASVADGSALPSWLAFDPSTQTLSGTAPADSILTGSDGDDVLVDTDTGIAGAWDIKVIATDTAGISADDTFTLTLQGVAGNDTLEGGKGNDVLNGGGGNDTYIYNQGDGLDALADREGQDAVSFGAGYSFANTVIRKEGDTARLRFLNADGNETSEGMDIALNGDGTSPIEVFTFADGSSHTLTDLTITSQTWYGDKKANTIITGRNDDTVYAGKGGDTVYTSTGNDALYGDKGNDKLYGEGGNDKLYGGKGKDFLDGGAGDDILDGGEGHNTLIGGQGNDTLILGKGEDTVRFGLGDGWDTLKATAKDPEDSEIRFGEGITKENLWLSRSGNDLQVNVLGTDDGLTIQGWYDSRHKPIEEFKTANGDELAARQVGLLVQAMAGFSPTPGSGNPLPTEMPQELQATLAAAWESEH